MGREVRRVPEGWEHPKNDKGYHQPMYDESFREAADKWEAGHRAFVPPSDDPDCRYWEWDGDPPDRAYYRPEWAEEQCTHYQLYETVSEGTPLSPPMPTLEALADWLGDNGTYWQQNAEARGESRPWDRRLSRDEWLRFLVVGSAPSMVVSSRGVETGVEFVARQPPTPVPPSPEAQDGD